MIMSHSARALEVDRIEPCRHSARHTMYTGATEAITRRNRLYYIFLKRLFLDEICANFYSRTLTNKFSGERHYDFDTTRMRNIIEQFGSHRTVITDTKSQ